MKFEKPFDFKGQVAVITGGGGILCGTMAQYLAQCGASVAVVSLHLESAQYIANAICKQNNIAKAFAADVLNKDSLKKLAEEVINAFGKVDILINGAGGTRKDATTADIKFADLPENAIRWVFDLNFMGTFLPCQVFCPIMFKQNSGKIINISSMGSLQPLTKSPAYCAAKAAITNFTQWLAVHISQEYTANIRVNAIMPGFFLTKQNKFLLMDEKSGKMTPRGRNIIDHTPMARLGAPEDLVGPVMGLLSDTFGFVHGTTLIVDGGMSAYGGV